MLHSGHDGYHLGRRWPKVPITQRSKHMDCMDVSSSPGDRRQHESYHRPRLDGLGTFRELTSVETCWTSSSEDSVGTTASLGVRRRHTAGTGTSTRSTEAVYVFLALRLCVESLNA